MSSHLDAQEKILLWTFDTSAKRHLKNCSDPHLQGLYLSPRLGPPSGWSVEGGC